MDLKKQPYNLTPYKQRVKDKFKQYLKLAMSCRLLEKYQIELQLIKDAQERGWQKEIDRHTNVAQRVKQIIRDLGGE
ncbi:hypothetical protein [Candidatus Paracaedibacter symbiosus]|uniref:hypothetical protein n=1 Tax=Candidatus Paracaedibacter symbiosus TaxID=244582 RepID=UPI00050998C6|nr:hypothetical protein [Candidatus Paracaedibacter symbiosus]